MRVYAYVIEHDLGFAPNPFHGACTLACCKPKIRKGAAVGDLILGMGAVKPKLGGHLCYWMKVDEILTFDEYWTDPRFRRKRPVMTGTTFLRYGDNIYHHEGSELEYRQEDSFHSLPDGMVSLPNLERDTKTTNQVLVGWDFAYWGRSGIEIPDHLSRFKIKSPGHKCRFSEAEISELLLWLNGLGKGLLGEPAHWQFMQPHRIRKTQAEGRERESRRL